jgi:hypothetical protein
LFAADAELRRFAAVLSAAHGLALSAAVPRYLRADLARAIDALDEVLHRRPA